MPAPTTARQWEERLKGEGLASLDTDIRLRGASIKTDPAAASEAVTKWQVWARGVLGTHRFRNAQDRMVWQMYAEGNTLTVIQVAIGKSRRRVTEAIAEVESIAGAPPIPNPWSKVRRYTGKLNPRMKFYRARKARQLERIYATVGARMQDKPKAPSPMLFYKSILFLPGRDILVPGAARTGNTSVHQVEGRPTVGGIDVYAASGKTLPEIVTIPWGAIRQANRELPQGEP